MSDKEATDRRLGFAVKVLGREGIKSHDTRRWQSGPSLGVSLESLRATLAYLVDVGISMYRISSDFVPYATHPDMPQFHGQIEEHASELAEIGRLAADHEVRLSLHPSQYVVLNAQDEAIAKKSMADLDSQARLLDALRQDEAGVVVLHVGGAYGDKESSMQRFIANYERLTEPARRRLVIENDEVAFTIEDCLWISARTGLRIVFDHHHHRLNPGGLSTEEAARAALDSWPAGTLPKIHFSSARLDGRQVEKGRNARLKPPLLRQHADYVDPWTFADLLRTLRDRRFDVMIEAKAKDLAVLKLRADLATIRSEDVLLQAD